MKRLFAFQQKKFLTLSLKAQHKKCAELLHELLKNSPVLIAHYRELCSWMGLLEPANEREALLDRYHLHLAQSDTVVKEHNFFITSQDRTDAAPSLSITIYLERLRSSHNVGAILRTAEAFRLGEVIFSEEMADFSHPKVQKSAMGAEKWISCQKKSLSSCPGPLIALETATNAIPLYDFVFPASCTIALGNEEYGLSTELLNQAAFCIQIPLFGRKNSLNVASSFAIVAAEISRQQRFAKNSAVRYN